MEIGGARRFKTTPFIRELFCFVSLCCSEEKWFPEERRFARVRRFGGGLVTVFVDSSSSFGVLMFEGFSQFRGSYLKECRFRKITEFVNFLRNIKDRFLRHSNECSTNTMPSKDTLLKYLVFRRSSEIELCILSEMKVQGINHTQCYEKFTLNKNLNFK